MKKNEVAKRDQKTEVADEAAAVALWGETEETGFEGMGQDDFALPFLKLLQKGSHEVDEDDGAYVEGAKPGMFYDTATGELFDEVEVVNCHYRHAIVEWAGSEPGSGFVGQHEPGYEQSFPRHKKDGRETGAWVTPDGHILQDTRYFFCLRLAGDGSALPCVVSMTSTQIKKSKTWNSRMANLRIGGKPAPRHSQIWKLTSVAEDNDFGSWKGFKIDRVGTITDPDLAASAVAARDMFKGAAGNLKPPAEGGQGDEKKDEVPF